MDKMALEEILHKKLKPLSNKIRSKSLDEFSDSIKFISSQYDDIVKKLDKAEKERLEILQDNMKIKSDLMIANKEIEGMKEQLNNLEQYGRRDCLEFRGIPVTNHQKSEDTDAIVVKIAEAVGISLNKQVISVSHRVPKKIYFSSQSDGDGLSPTIIAKFMQRSIRDQVYRNRKLLPNVTTDQMGFKSQNKIFISESLTSKNKALFSRCLQLKKNLNFKFIWTSNGTIFLRKNEHSEYIRISSHKDIQTKINAS